MLSMTRRTLLTIAAGAWALQHRGLSIAQAAPELKSLQIHVPVPPGAQPDLIARWLAEPLARRAGVPVNVINRPGAAGAIAADAVLSASAETGPLLLGGLDHVAYSHQNSDRRPLDPFIDFVPVGTVNRDSWLVVTGSDSGPPDVASLRDGGRGPISYASNGELSTGHLLSARLCRALGVDGQHVAYRDSLMPDLIAGRITFAVLPTPAVLSQVRGGRLRALGALTRTRLPALPDVPTLIELGHADQVFHGGLFLFAPAALRGQAQRLNGWLVETQRLPDIAARYAEAAIEPMPLDLEQTRQSVAERLRLVDAMRAATFGRGRAG